LGKKDKREEVVNALNSYAERYNNPELKKKIDFTISGGTFTKYMLEKAKAIKNSEIEIEKMRDELIKMDEEERDKKYSSKDSYVINIFAAGYFQIPKDYIDKCFEILNIDSNVKERLTWYFNQNIVPVINPYTVEIKSEGYEGGNLEYKGVESYKNMYRIRKAFFENKFYKTDIGF
jgi:hypothetical protein